MRFLLDQNRSPRLGDLLREAGHEAFHAQELSLERAEDSEILRVSADLNQGAIVVVLDDRVRIRRLPLLE